MPPARFVDVLKLLTRAPVRTISVSLLGVGLSLLARRLLTSLRRHGLLAAASDPHVASFLASAPGEWEYLAEGALNLTCKYAGSDPRLVGRVLRLRKLNAEASKGASRSNPYVEGRRFEETVILPLLGRRYVQPSIEVPLRASFLEALGGLLEPHRPEWRREFGLDPLLETGLLMIDNTAIRSVPGEAAVCVELKVKCGFLPTSPFVTHEVKRRVSAFRMHQQLKLKKGKETVPSRYDPVDLFSADAARVRRALLALVEVPQNNLQLFANGTLVFPADHASGGFERLDAALRQGGFKGDGRQLVDVLCDILMREPLLPRVLSAQMLDDCDVEGVGTVYERMLARGDAFPSLADGPPLEVGRPPPHRLPGDDEPEEQQQLLRRFLISKTAKDCSVMITIKPDTDAASDADADADADADSRTDLRSLPIRLEAERTVVRGFRGFAYSIAAVDLDPKPVGKMQHYVELDRKMATLYAELESRGALR